MIAPVERTGEFLAALAAHHSPPEGASLIVPPPSSPRHEFTQLAVKLTAKIDDMRSFLQKCHRRYTDFSPRGMQDVERDEIDAATVAFLRSAVAQINELKHAAVKEVQKDAGASFPAHKLGVVMILNEDLQKVSELSEQLRGARIKEAIEVKKRGTGVKYDRDVAREMAEERKTKVESQGDVEEDFLLMEQEFARENVSLINELVETRESVRQAERTVLEIASLNAVFAAKVLEQAKEVEVLYDLAVEATTYMERGNRELKKMKKRGPVLKYALAAFAVFLALMLLFAEWISR